MRKNYGDMYPGYGELDVDIPEGFENVSFVNDSCPSFIDHEAGLHMSIEYKDPGERSLPPEDGLDRFHLTQMVTNDPVAGWQMDDNAVTLASTEDYAEVLVAIDAARRPSHPAP